MNNIDQIRNDMKRYNTPFAVLVVDKLPKNAKAKGFHVDTGMGVLITAPPELVVPTITMFYEIHASCYAQHKKTLNMELVAADKDLTHYLNDNMTILDDCKEISDAIDDSTRKVKGHLSNITSRLRDNTAKMGQILAGFSGGKTDVGDPRW